MDNIKSIKNTDGNTRNEPFLLQAMYHSPRSLICQFLPYTT